MHLYLAHTMFTANCPAELALLEQKEKIPVLNIWIGRTVETVASLWATWNLPSNVSPWPQCQTSSSCSCFTPILTLALSLIVAEDVSVVNWGTGRVGSYPSPFTPSHSALLAFAHTSTNKALNHKLSLKLGFQRYCTKESREMKE